MDLVSRIALLKAVQSIAGALPAYIKVGNKGGQNKGKRGEAADNAIIVTDDPAEEEKTDYVELVESVQSVQELVQEPVQELVQEPVQEYTGAAKQPQKKSKKLDFVHTYAAASDQPELTGADAIAFYKMRQTPFGI